MVNFSAQSSQSTSIVGKPFSLSFSPVSLPISQSSIMVSQSLSSLATSQTTTWWVAGVSNPSRVSERVFKGVKARGAGGGKPFALGGEIKEGEFSGEG